MKRYSALFALAIILGVATHSASAQETSSRYVLKSIEEGFIRLDTKTGAISTCRGERGNMICRTTADDRAVLQEEIERLQKENDALRAKLTKAAADKKTGKNTLGLPNKDDIDRVMTYFEGWMKRFFKFTETMKKSIGSDT